MYTIQARLSTVDGKGVGRWRKYYDAEDLREARWAVADLVQSAQMRVMEGKQVVVPPCRVRDFMRQDLYAVRKRLRWITSQPMWLEDYGDEAQELAEIVEKAEKAEKAESVSVPVAREP